MRCVLCVSLLNFADYLKPLTMKKSFFTKRWLCSFDVVPMQRTRHSTAPRLDALTEQISAAAHTIYSKCYTTHAGKNRLMDQGRWNKIEYLYILTILGTNDVCVANKQTCNLK